MKGRMSDLSLDNPMHCEYDYYLQGRARGKSWNGRSADILNQVLLKTIVPVRAYPSFIEGYVRSSGMLPAQMAFERRRVLNFLAGKKV
jgi:hypothetical protein